MYFKNKNTGITWHITDEGHQRRLQANGDYLDVTNSITLKEPETPRSEPVSESVLEKTDLKSLDWQELRKLATESGINIHGLKRKQIERKLLEVGGVNDSK